MSWCGFNKSVCCSDKNEKKATFADKWKYTELVGTDDSESKFITNCQMNPPRLIQRKFCYYYSDSDLTNIIEEWKSLKLCNIKETMYHVRDNFYQRFFEFSLENPLAKRGILITSCVHSREVATVTSTIAFIDEMIKSPDSLLKHFNFHVCFIFNPHGYSIDNSFTSASMSNIAGKSYRKNGNGYISGSNKGVDLNRNCYFEGTDTSLSIAESDTYRGKEPKSEIEIQNFLNYVSDKEFLVYIDVHSYANDVLVESSDDGSGKYKFPVLLKDVQEKYKGLEKLFPTSDSESKSKTRRADIITFHTNALDLGYGCYGCINDYLCYEYLKNNKTLYTFTFEIGNSQFDKFYPSEYEMIDIIYNFKKSMNLILNYYN